MREVHESSSPRQSTTQTTQTSTTSTDSFQPPPPPAEYDLYPENSGDTDQQQGTSDSDQQEQGSSDTDQQEQGTSDDTDQQQQEQQSDQDQEMPDQDETEVCSVLLYFKSGFDTVRILNYLNVLVSMVYFCYVNVVSGREMDSGARGHG